MSAAGTVLVTGGAGYIGSHIVLALQENGEDVVVIDSLEAGDRSLLPSDIPFYRADIRDAYELGMVLKRHRVRSIIHCAGSLSVPESVHFPLHYFRSNIGSAWAIADAAPIYGIKEVIFSSTAAVYGDQDGRKISEAAPLNPVSPYGASKMMAERCLKDCAEAGGFAFTALRYFNVAGADPQMRAGYPSKMDPHLLPCLAALALGHRDQVDVFGSDFPTRDGTCERDYIHVSDLADAHIALLRAMRAGLRVPALNAGYGRGTTVREAIYATQTAMARPIGDIRFMNRREGDPASLVADSTALRSLTGWEPRFDCLELIAAHGIAWAERRWGNHRR